MKIHDLQTRQIAQTWLHQTQTQNAEPLQWILRPRSEPEKLSAEGTKSHVCYIVGITNDHGGGGERDVTSQTSHRFLASLYARLNYIWKESGWVTELRFLSVTICNSIPKEEYVYSKCASRLSEKTQMVAKASPA